METKKKTGQEGTGFGVDCRENVKVFLISLTYKRARIESYTFLQ